MSRARAAERAKPGRSAIVRAESAVRPIGITGAGVLIPPGDKTQKNKARKRRRTIAASATSAVPARLLLRIAERAAGAMGGPRLRLLGLPRSGDLPLREPKLGVVLRVRAADYRGVVRIAAIGVRRLPFTKARDRLAAVGMPAPSAAPLMVAVKPFAAAPRMAEARVSVIVDMVAATLGLADTVIAGRTTAIIEADTVMRDSQGADVRRMVGCGVPTSIAGADGETSPITVAGTLDGTIPAAVANLAYAGLTLRAAIAREF